MIIGLSESDDAIFTIVGRSESLFYYRWSIGIQQSNCKDYWPFGTQRPFLYDRWPIRLRRSFITIIIVGLSESNDRIYECGPFGVPRAVVGPSESHGPSFADRNSTTPFVQSLESNDHFVVIIGRSESNSTFFLRYFADRSPAIPFSTIVGGSESIDICFTVVSE